MMSDLMSKGELFNKLATVQTLGEAYGVIQGMETVDAIPVRCKDCKFYYRMTAETGICQLGCPHLGNDGFCSEGERKDGEHDRG